MVGGRRRAGGRRATTTQQSKDRKMMTMMNGGVFDFFFRIIAYPWFFLLPPCWLSSCLLASRKAKQPSNKSMPAATRADHRAAKLDLDLDLFFRDSPAHIRYALGDLCPLFSAPTTRRRVAPVARAALSDEHLLGLMPWMHGWLAGLLGWMRQATKSKCKSTCV